MNLKFKHLLQEAMKASIGLVNKHSNIISRYSSLKDALDDDNDFSKEFKDKLKPYIVLLPVEDHDAVVDFFNLDIGYFDSCQRLTKESNEEEYIAIPLGVDTGLLEFG